MRRILISLLSFSAFVLAAPATHAQCVRTLNTTLVANNQGNTGGTMYFDLVVRNPILVSGFDMNYEAAVGTPVGLRVHTRAGTHVGNEVSPTGWTQVGQDNGGAISAARNGRTGITLATPFQLLPGTHGIALVAVGSNHAYTNGTGFNQLFEDESVSIRLGSASNVPFSAPTFTPRIWNGALRYSADALLPSFVATNTSGNSPLSVSFTDTSCTSHAAGVTGWAWDFDSNGTVDSTLQNPTHIYNACGYWNVTLTISDATHAPASVTRQNLVLVDPQQSVSASFQSSLTSGCVPLIVQFTDTSSGNPTSWAWDLDGDSIIDSTERNPSRIYTQPDQVFTVSLRVTNSTCNGSSSSSSLIRTRQALTTLPTSNNQGNSGGIMYFDMTVSNNVEIFALEMNYQAVLNAAVGVLMYSTPTTYMGVERNQAAWTLVGQDNGLGRAAGRERRTTLTLASPVPFTPGSYGVALVAVGTGHAYTNGNGPNQNYSDANLALTLGTAANVPFDPLTTTVMNFPRVWNGALLYCTDCPGTSASRGLGCADTQGTPLAITTTGCPRLGSTFGISLRTSAANTSGVFLLMGTSNQNWLGIVLPLDFGLFGAPSCSAYVSHDLVLGPFNNPGGGGGFQAPIPVDPTLRLAPTYWQGYLLDIGLNPLNLGTSDYRTVIIG